MSIIISIEPIDTITRDGWPTRVTGIDMTSGDPFVGTLEYEPGKHRSARWRLNGNMRDAPPHWNLVLEQPELQELYDVAKRLGARLS
jgi:hypothetical protein